MKQEGTARSRLCLKILNYTKSNTKDKTGINTTVAATEMAK